MMSLFTFLALGPAVGAWVLEDRQRSSSKPAKARKAMRISGLGSVVLVVLGTAQSASAQIVLDASGRTLSAPTELSAKQPLTIRMPAAEEVDCNKVGSLELRYRAQATLPERAEVLSDGTDGGTSDCLTNGVFSIPAGDLPFVVFNVRRVNRAALNDTALTGAKADREHASDALKTARAKAEYDKWLSLTKPGQPTDDEKRRDTLISEISILEKEEAAYTKMVVENGVAPLTSIEADLHKKRTELSNLEASIAATKDAGKKAIADIEKSDAFAKMKEAERELAVAEAAIAGAVREGEKEAVPRGLVVLKMGVLVRGSGRKVAHFSFSPFRPDENLSAQLVGDLPVLTQDDALYVEIANRQRTHHPETLTLTVAANPGTPIDEAGVRPPDSSGEKSGQRTKTGTSVTVADDAYDDVVLSVGKRFAGNDIPKLTLKTWATVISEDKKSTNEEGKVTSTHAVERKEVTLLDNFSLPQVHPLYRFNLAVAVTYSQLQDREFAKVQTARDDPATTTEDESRYRIDESEASRRFRPALALTWYWKPIDPLMPLRGVDRLLPQPTIAFGASDPLDNVFIGFSNEVSRSVQVLWGYHLGTQSELKPRSDVDEERRADLPGKRDRAKGAFFVGLSFNLKGFGKLLGLAG